MLYLRVEVSAYGLLSPRLEIEFSSALLFWIPNNICHSLGGKWGKCVFSDSSAQPGAEPQLLLEAFSFLIQEEAPICFSGSPSQASHFQIPALGLQPVIDEALRVSGKAQHEFPLGLQLVDGFYGLMDL